VKCPRCQHENPPESNFCLGCGARLGLTCASCGIDLPAGSRFCNKCGTPVKAQAADPRFTSLDSYTPKHLAERILTSKAALEGERKQVTVLFADLKGSMELLADRDPEEARNILDPVLEHMMEAVHRYEGTVNQVMGDGIMALFGAPIALEDHAVRACYAALRMQESVKRYSDEVRRAVGVPISIRVGLNSGAVVVRSVGSDLRMDYTAVGQTTHLAARMEQAAAPGSIVVAADTWHLAEGYVRVKPLGPTQVKGMAEPVDLYEVVGAAAVRTRFHVTASRGLSRFVGRDSELGQLRRALRLAAEGRGQLVAVVGEPGVGKSRLYWEFIHSRRTQAEKGATPSSGSPGGWLVLESGSVSYGKATPYLPIVDLLKAYFRIGDTDDSREIREKVIGKLLALDRALESTIPAFLALLDVPGEDAQWRALDPDQRRQRTIGAVRRLLLRESQVQPLLVVFEDLHWFDAESQSFLDTLVESLPAARVLLLVNYRPEHQHGWTNKTHYTHLRLDALPSESAAVLLGALLGEDPGLAPLAELLIARTGGNPFFIEETVRTLVETKALIGEPGAYRLTGSVQTIEVPASVQAVLAARVDHLPAEEKRLLQAAAVVGKDVPFVILQHIADLEDDVLRRGLGHLQSAEFLYETSLFPDLEYTFKHALTYEVAYSSMLHDRRRALHARIVSAIERLYADRLAEHIERLADHAQRGGEWDRAVRYGREAGRKALARSANREATGYFEQALSAIPRLPEARSTQELAVDLRLDLYQSMMPLDELRPLLGYLREAESLAAALGDRERLGWARLHICHVLALIDDMRRVVELGHEVRAIADAVGNRTIEAVAYLWLGCGYYALGRHRKAADLLGQSVALGQSLLPHGGRGPGYPGYLSMFLAELGEFARAEEAAEVTMGAVETWERPWNLLNACWQVGSFHCLKGDFHRALPLLERGISAGIESGFKRTTAIAAGVLGYALALSGRAAEGAERLEQGLRHMEALSVTWMHCQRVNFLGEAHLLAGRQDDAKATAERALRLSRERGERGFEAWCLRLLGEISVHGDPADSSAAEGHYREAHVLATELEMRPLVAHCHLGLGKFFRRTGKRQEAHEHLGTAVTMYREMGMTHWLEQAGAETRELA
jgi:class 3 adenylate cyclase/tetratricopeptide (TPR) repeat protein